MDNFDNDKIAPQALNLFAQNLQLKLKNATVNNKTKKLTISQQIQQQYQKSTGDEEATSLNSQGGGAEGTPSGLGLREVTQANLNLINLNLIMKDPISFHNEIERKEAEKKLKISGKTTREEKEKELAKYTKLDNRDLFTSEARKALTKFKIYRPKAKTIRSSPETIREVKTSGKIATENDFDVIEFKEPPASDQLRDEDVMATQMDLYLTINLTENLQKARIKRKQDRMMEEEALKLTKVKGFKETLSGISSLDERMKMETELLQEFKRLRKKVHDLRLQRAKLSAFNTALYN